MFPRDLTLRETEKNGKKDSFTRVVWMEIRNQYFHGNDKGGNGKLGFPRELDGPRVRDLHGNGKDTVAVATTSDS